MSGVGAPEQQNLGLFYIVTLCFYLPLLVIYNSVKYFPSGLFKLCLCCLQQEVIAPAATLLRSVTFTMEALYKRTWTHQCIKVLLLLFNFLSVWLHRRWEMWNCNRTEQLTETSGTAAARWLHGGDCSNRWSTVLCEKCWVCLNPNEQYSLCSSLKNRRLIFLVAAKTILFLREETKVFVGILHHVKLK